MKPRTRVSGATPVATQSDDVRYRQKYKLLKQKLREIEQENDRLDSAILRSKKQIHRLRLERSVLYDRLSTSTPPTKPWHPHPDGEPYEFDPMDPEKLPTIEELGKREGRREIWGAKLELEQEEEQGGEEDPNAGSSRSGENGRDAQTGVTNDKTKPGHPNHSANGDADVDVDMADQTSSHPKPASPPNLPPSSSSPAPGLSQQLPPPQKQHSYTAGPPSIATAPSQPPIAPPYSNRGGEERASPNTATGTVAPIAPVAGTTGSNSSSPGLSPPTTATTRTQPPSNPNHPYPSTAPPPSASTSIPPEIGTSSLSRATIANVPNPIQNQRPSSSSSASTSTTRIQRPQSSSSVGGGATAAAASPDSPQQPQQPSSGGGRPTSSTSGPGSAGLSFSGLGDSTTTVENRKAVITGGGNDMAIDYDRPLSQGNPSVVIGSNDGGGVPRPRTVGGPKSRDMERDKSEFEGVKRGLVRMEYDDSSEEEQVDPSEEESRHIRDDINRALSSSSPDNHHSPAHPSLPNYGFQSTSVAAAGNRPGSGGGGGTSGSGSGSHSAGSVSPHHTRNARPEGVEQPHHTRNARPEGVEQPHHPRYSSTTTSSHSHYPYPSPPSHSSTMRNHPNPTIATGPTTSGAGDQNGRRGVKRNHDDEEEEKEEREKTRRMEMERD